MMRLGRVRFVQCVFVFDIEGILAGSGGRFLLCLGS